MKIRIRGVLELIEWGFESIADRFGIQRRHVLFGIFVLLLSTFITAWYIYQKNWVIAGEIKAGQSEKYTTVSLDGEESAMQEMANEIRKSILDTPMAAAATSESMAQSSASSNAQRSEPQNSAANQSAFASPATTSASSAGASSSSFKPTAAQPNTQVMAGQARSENSQSMAAASPVPVSRSTAGRQSIRSNPQSEVTQSVVANRSTSPNSASSAGKDRPVSPPISPSNISKMSTGGAKSVSGESMSAALSNPPKIQAVPGASAARSIPQTSAVQSSVVASSTAAEISSSSAANPNSSISPSSVSRVSPASVKAEAARAEVSQGMSQVATQTAAKSASGNNSAHSDPQSVTAAQSVLASAQSLATTGIASQSGNIMPSLSGSRAASSGVQSSSAKSVVKQSMASATSQALAQASNVTSVSSRVNPVSASTAQRSALATRSAGIAASGSNGAKAASFVPSISGSRAAVSGVQNAGAKAVAGGSLSPANTGSLAQSVTGSRGSARGNPSGKESNGESSSVRSSNSVSAVLGSKGTGNYSLSPTVSGSRANAMGVRSTGAEAVNGQNLSGAATQSMAKSVSGSFGLSRGNTSGDMGNYTGGSAQGLNLAARSTGARSTGYSSFAPIISGRSMTVSGMVSHKAKAVAARNMAGISVVASSRPSHAMTTSARSGPASTRSNFTGSAGALTVRPSISDAGVTGVMSSIDRAIRAATPPASGLASVSSKTQPPVKQGFSNSRSRIGSSNPAASTQVMTQAGTHALVGPMKLGGLRSTRPAMAVKSGAESPTKNSARSVSVELRGYSGTSKQMNSRAQTDTRSQQPLPAVALNRQSPQLTAKLVPQQLTPKIELPVPRSKPTCVQLNDPESDAENPEIRKTKLEQFKSEGFNIRTESKGDRFVFIIDKSESMLDDDRMIGAKQALERTLDKLGPDKSYFIYFFSDKTFKMEPDRMLKATSDNKNETMKWVKTVSAEGFTNPRDALKDAFERLKPSTIWLLSDGKFSIYKSGRRSNIRRQERLTSVLRVIRELNVAQVKINTIGFAAREGKVDDSLREIAKENGGAYRFIPTGDK